MSGKSWSVISPTVVIKHISIKAVQNLKKNTSLPSNLHMVKMTMSGSKNLWPKHTQKKTIKYLMLVVIKDQLSYTLSSFLNIFISGSLNMLMIYFATEMHHNIYVLGCGIKNSP